MRHAMGAEIAGNELALQPEAAGERPVRPRRMEPGQIDPFITIRILVRGTPRASMCRAAEAVTGTTRSAVR
jgi:hypothetical protein